MAKGNKVQFNLKNFHYAILQDDTTSALAYTPPTYGTPVHVPGAVSLTLDSEGSVTPFYADGIQYYNAVSNNGYSGDLEVAKFTDEMLTAVWGFVKTEAGVLLENNSKNAAQFAALFQIDGDRDSEFYCMYNCSGTKPGVNAKTNEAEKEPQTQTSSITASALKDGTIMARTTADTAKETKAGWFNQVYYPDETAWMAATAGATEDS